MSRLLIERETRVKYADGQDVQLGDTVRLGQDANGVVVCSIDTDEYTDKYPKTQWGYLKTGVLVEFPKHGLIHYEKAEPDLKLVRRVKST